MRRYLLLAAVLFAPCATYAQQTPATTQAVEDQQQEQTRFLRFVGDSKSGGKLETSEVKFVNDRGQVVRLVSAVHVGEPSYYHQLQDVFAKCDAVLYEMVKDKNAPAPRRGEPRESGVAKLQMFLKDTLGLAYQLDEIDYTPKNFIHADLDAETFQRLQSERGESFAMLIMTAMIRSMSDPSIGRMYDDEPVDMLDFMSRPDGQGQIKLLLARRMGDIEREASGMDFLNCTVILTERNKAVTKALQQALNSGKKNIAIFYGAAHMPELSDRLDLMGFKPAETTWRTAWDVKIDPNAPSAFMKLMGKVNQQLQQSP
jgi:hypothetical protein